MKSLKKIASKHADKSQLSQVRHNFVLFAAVFLISFSQPKYLTIVIF